MDIKACSLCCSNSKCAIINKWMHFKYDISRCDYHRYQFIHTLFALYTSAISCSSPFFTPTAFRFVYYFLSISSFIFDMLVICYATLFVLYIFAITVYEIIICYFVFCSNRAIFSHYCYSCIRTNWLHEFHFFLLLADSKWICFGRLFISIRFLFSQSLADFLPLHQQNK